MTKYPNPYAGRPDGPDPREDAREIDTAKEDQRGEDLMEWKRDRMEDERREDQDEDTCAKGCEPGECHHRQPSPMAEREAQLRERN